MKRAVAFVTIALAGCAGEPLHAPDVPTAAGYTAAPLAAQTASAPGVRGGDAQVFAWGRDIPAEWWTLFGSPALDRLVRRALDGSPTLARAGAKLREAEEQREARTGETRYPRVDAKLSANRVDVQPEAIGARALPVATPLNLYLASVGVSYHFDFFGATRNELEGLRRQVDAERFELEAARLMLAGNVVTAAIREASLREQIAIAGELVVLQERRLAIVERLESIGSAAHADVEAQRLELAETRALVPELERQLAQVRHRLAVYVGEAPGAAQLPELRLAELRLPAELPVSLPSELARQRPDIRASEALLARAAANVGVANANLYPQLTLSATLGSLTTHPGDLFSGGTAFSLLGASLTQPLFRGGALQAEKRAAVAAYDQSAAAYRDVVLRGLQDVADVLRALDSDAAKLAERAHAADAARSQHAIAAARFEAGGVSQLALLDVERRLRSALLDRTQAVADRYADSAALLQALGGGWWNVAPPAR
jgi:NodT family efflux transporter outer membrane factor (OMF) lipoprotein